MADGCPNHPAMTPLTACMLVAAGGAAGSVCRFLGAGLLDGRLGGLPVGTLAVNVAGCLLIGLAAGWIDRPWVKPLLMTGFLGGFTTFSAFSLQTLDLVQKDRWLAAGGYVAASLALCLAAVWAGWTLGRALASPAA